MNAIRRLVRSSHQPHIRVSRKQEEKATNSGYYQVINEIKQLVAVVSSFVIR